LLSFAAFQTADNDGYDMNRSDLPAWGGKPRSAERVQLNGAAGLGTYDSAQEAQAT
jgi:hypothetical protein